MRRFRLSALVLCALLLASCTGVEAPAMAPQTVPPSATVQAAPTQAATTAPAATQAPTAAPTAEPQPTQIELMAVGDLMFQSREIASAYSRDTKTYDFNYSFQYVKGLLGSADLALGNFECTLGGPRYTPRASIIFSTPDSTAEALKNAGFDVLSTANNHINNKGSQGIFRTMDLLGKQGITTTGTRMKPEDKPYVIVDVKGIKVGVAAYSWCTRLKGGRYELDYGVVHNDVAGLINVFAYSTLDADLQKMGDMAAQMRADGADIVAFYLHWGAEYRRPPDAHQLKMAQALSDAGVDILFGCHPHWLQTVDFLTGKGGNRTLVAYSLGNFISTQRDEIHGAGYNFKYSEDNMILDVKITRAPGGKAEISSVGYIPTWNYMYTQDGKPCYTVLPLQAAIASPEKYGLNPDPKSRSMKDALKSLNHTDTLLADAVSKGVLFEIK